MTLLRSLAFLPGLAATAWASLPAPSVHILSQTTAIEGVCAWPKLTLLPGGDIAAAIFNQPSHGVRPGDVDCYASTDGGLTWQLRGTATRHTSSTSYLNHAIGVNRQGELLIVSSGWNYRGQNAQGAYIKGDLLQPVACRSADGGRTWTISDKFPNGRDGTPLIPFGNIQSGDDGTLHVAAYAYQPTVKPRRDVCYSVESRDGGATWSVGAVIGEPAANETDLMPMGGGQWLAAARNLNPKGHSIDIYVSDDDARSFHLLATATTPNEHPGDLLKLADGRVLLTVGDRRSPDMGVNARLSSDGGKTWTEPARISEGILTRDSGYPSTVQLKDGTLVTAFYAAKTKTVDHYQMGVIRWQLK